MQKIFIFVSAVIALAYGQGIGTQLSRTALIYSNLPMNLTEAIEAGWYNFTNSYCDPNIGIAYSQEEDGPTQGYPITVYFSESGQISGMGMTHFGQPAAGLEDFWVADSNGDGNYLMTVSFRDPSAGLCTANNEQPEYLGTQVVVNQGSLNFVIPLDNTAAEAAEFTAGGCIGHMGTHWSYDLKTHPEMSWVPSNLAPVVAMYNDRPLSAFFFTTPTLQYSEPFGPWEGPIPDNLMCLNWCDSSCDFNINFWNTLHFFITDPDLDICDSRCPEAASF